MGSVSPIPSIDHCHHRTTDTSTASIASTASNTSGGRQLEISSA